MCPQDLKIDKGIVEYKTTILNEEQINVASFKCNRGYILTGTPVRYCLAPKLYKDQQDYFEFVNNITFNINTPPRPTIRPIMEGQWTKRSPVCMPAGNIA